MTDLPLLISTLEEGGEGSRELDARIHVALNPEQQVLFDHGDVRTRRPASRGPLSAFRLEGWSDWDGVANHVGAPPYTTSVDAALALIGERLPGWTYTLTYWPPDAEAGFTRVTLGGPGYISDDWEHDTFEVRREGNVPAVALCLALCRALQAQGETHDA